MKRFKRIRSFTRRNAGLILFVLGMFCMRTGVADWSYVPTGSMEPTLYPGDWLLVSKRHYGPSIPFTDSRLFTLGEPSRGDVITFYPRRLAEDRKSTRLNSSHVKNSYAVFCLKKKKITNLP